MRRVATFEKEDLARRLSFYLQKKGIENTIEVVFDSALDRFSYLIWVYNEDRMQEAELLFEDFQKNPEDPKFDVFVKEVIGDDPIFEEGVKPRHHPKPKSYPITVFLFALCVFIFLLNWYQERTDDVKPGKVTYRILTPVQYLLFYDVPYELVELDKLVHKYDIDLQKDLKEQPIEVQKEIQKIDKMPFWKGFYEIVIDKIKNPSAPLKISGPLFEKVREGQLWRLISPCFLHVSFFHILFNLIWLWVLGKQIEERLSISRYLLLILTIGLISNFAQYLMSGPYFLGFSGIIMGEVGFIWSRDRKAPWEGYPLQKAVFLFLAIYVLAMGFLQIVSLFFEIFQWGVFPVTIANTAHIVGALVGAFLGTLPFFARRPLER